MLSQLCFFIFWLSFYSKVSFSPPHATPNLVPALFQMFPCCPKETNTCSWFLGANDGSEWSCWAPAPGVTVGIVWCGPGIVSPQPGPGCSLKGPTERTVLKAKSENCWLEHRQTLACGERGVWAWPPPKGKPDASLQMSPEWSKVFTKMVFGFQQIRIIGTGGVWKPLLLSCSVMPNSFQPHGLQHTRLPCP